MVIVSKITRCYRQALSTLKSLNQAHVVSLNIDVFLQDMPVDTTEAEFAE